MSEEEAKKLSEKFTELTEIKCECTFMEKGNNHKPSTLRDNKCGVYVFLLSDKGVCFKVGKAGANSKMRWESHHYRLDKKIPSTFTKSFLSDLDNFRKNFDNNERIEHFKQTLKKYNIKDLKNDIKNIDIKKLNDDLNLESWIKNNIDRIEFIIPECDNGYGLNLLEALIQFKFEPIYEGKMLKSAKHK